MPARLVLIAVLCLAGCRLEPPPDVTATSDCDCSDGRDVAESVVAERTQRRPDPPVRAGDTVRVTKDAAGRPDPADRTRSVAPSGLAIPVAGVAPGDLVDTFEAARSEGRSHDAIDILAPRGTPVVAVADGEIARLFTSDKGGLTIYQVGDALGAGGLPVYYYAHLDAYAPGLRAGQRVRRGQTIGAVGDTGNAVPGNTHLHFAIWTVADPDDFWDGTPVNPYPVLGGR